MICNKVIGLGSYACYAAVTLDRLTPCKPLFGQTVEHGEGTVMGVWDTSAHSRHNRGHVSTRWTLSKVLSLPKTFACVSANDGIAGYPSMRTVGQYEVAMDPFIGW